MLMFAYTQPRIICIGGIYIKPELAIRNVITRYHCFEIGVFDVKNPNKVLESVKYR